MRLEPFAATRLSVVVPTKNSGRTIAACLHAARRQTLPVELIVVDNTSEDETLSIASAIADKVETCGPERSAQRNRGALIASGEFVLFLDSDLILEPHVVAEALQAFDTDPRIGALVIPELAFGEGFWAQCRVLEKLIYQGDRTVEAARIFRRAALDMIGGYDESLTGGEDWDLPDRLPVAGWSVGRITAAARHDEGRLRLTDTFHKKRYYGRSIPRYLRQAGRTGVRRLIRVGLFRRPDLLLRHPVRATGLIILKVVEALGLATGMLASRRST